MPLDEIRGLAQPDGASGNLRCVRQASTCRLRRVSAGCAQHDHFPPRDHATTGPALAPRHACPRPVPAAGRCAVSDSEGRARARRWRYHRAWRGGVADRQVHHRRQSHPQRIRPRGQGDQRTRRRPGRRPQLSVGGAVLRRRIDPGARCAARRAADPAGRRAVHARAVQLGSDPGDRAGHRALPGADGGGQRRLARVVQQGLPLPVRGAVHLRAIPAGGDQPRRRAGAGGRAGSGGADHRGGHRERSVFAGHSRRRDRRRGPPRHAGGNRRQAAARPQRHDHHAAQGQGVAARPAAGVRPHQGRRAAGAPGRGTEGLRPHRRHHALRVGRGDRRRAVRECRRGHPVRRAMGADPDLPGRPVRQRLRLCRAVRTGVRLRAALPGGGIHGRGHGVGGRAAACRLVRHRDGPGCARRDRHADLLRQRPL